MQDPRALANTRNLESWRAWDREGQRRSGSVVIIMIVTLFTPVFTLSITLFEHAARDTRAFALMVGGAFALYVAVALGSMLFAVLRLRAWRRAHPWAPPSSPSRAG